MDVAQKKQEVLERIAEAPAGIVFARIDILNEVQLADLLKASFVPYLRQAANTSHSNTDSLHEVCTNLAKQRALLQGASVTDVLSFNIDDGNAPTRANGTGRCAWVITPSLYCETSQRRTTNPRTIGKPTAIAIPSVISCRWPATFPTAA